MASFTDMYEPLLNVKRCPFCGKFGRVEIITEEFYNEVVDKYGSALVDIECRTCHMALRSYPSEHPGEDYNERRKGLVDMWNTRGGRVS